MARLSPITKGFYKVVDFIDWASRNRIILSPDFQRNSVWKEGAKSFLIDTVVRGFPIPIIFLRERESDAKTFEPLREVIDGQQRLRTLIAFIAPEVAKRILKNYDPKTDVFTVSKDHNPEIGGLAFKDLSYDNQQFILNYEFSVHVVPADVDDRDIYSIFRRMNSTNFTLKTQELRNSQFFGLFKTSQYSLAGEQLNRWRSWKTFADYDIARMDEVELTSEISIAILEKKISGKNAKKIGDFYRDYNSVYKERKIVEKRFRDTMDFINDNFSETDSIFLQKRLFYTFFMVCYHLLFGLTSDFKSHAPKPITDKIINDLKAKSGKIKDRSAKKPVLDATDRRTTNIKERNALFNYLMSGNA